MRRREGYRNLFKNNCLLSKYKGKKGPHDTNRIFKKCQPKKYFSSKSTHDNIDRQMLPTLLSCRYNDLWNRVALMCRSHNR